MWALTLLKLVLGNVKINWKPYLITLLVALQFGTLSGCEHEHSLFIKEKANHQMDIANFKKAQVEADTKAQAEKTQIQKEATADAKQADENYSTLLAKYNANLLRYKANQSGTSQPNHNQVQSAQGSDGSGSGPDLSSVTISLDDANVCAINTARLEAVHDWATEVPKSDANASPN